MVSAVALIEKTGQMSCSYTNDVGLAARPAVAVYHETRTHGDSAGRNLLKLLPDRLLHRGADRA